MTTALILLVSGVLIGAGVTLVWRDARAKRRRAFVSERDARPVETEPEAEITISYDASAQARPNLPAAETISSARPPLPQAQPLAQLLALPAAEPKPSRQLPPARDSAPSRQTPSAPLEQEWASLQPTVSGGVDKVNAVLAPVRLSVSASGEPSWSYKNRGYGAYRRVLLQGESVAWLRLELSPEGKLNASVKAHKEERSDINAAADTPTRGLTPARTADLLSQCLRLAAGYAVRQQPGRDGDEEASKRAWESIDAMVAAALQATNGALAQAGARLNPLAPAAFESELRHHRMTLSVEVNGDDIARMHIERHPHEMEVAVGVRDPHLVDLGRRRRVPIEGMTIHVLAELMASCAWPAIARFREATHRA
jgi:hypothetical protein